MGCGQRESRESVQTTMATLNRHWHVINTYEPAPDGDVALDDHFVYDFQVLFGISISVLFYNKIENDIF